jgi:hypothetical protein
MAQPRRRTGRAGQKQRPPEARPLCSVSFCPICMAVTAVGEARPELADHLLAAGREVLLALRGLIDARLEESGGSGRLERLRVE